MYPFATAIEEALRTYFDAAARVESGMWPLLAGQRRKMHCYFKLGVDQKLLPGKDGYRELHRDLEKQFLEDFMRKREFAQLKLYTRRLSECALMFQDKVEAVLDKSAAVEKALASLRTCPLEKPQLQCVLSTLQSLVAQPPLIVPPFLVLLLLFPSLDPRPALRNGLPSPSS